MMLKNFLRSSKIFPAFWICLSLGSCSVVHYTDQSIDIFPDGADGQFTIPGCGAFERTVRPGHQRPVFPKVDVKKLTNDERTDLLLSHMERLKVYMENDEKFLKEDMAAHRAECNSMRPVFQK